jgi:hypothetical protein
LNGHTLLQICDGPHNSEPANQACCRYEQRHPNLRRCDRTALLLRHGAALAAPLGSESLSNQA